MQEHGMRLFWSSRSPFVRKVMVVAHEVGLADQIQCVRTRVPLTDNAPPLLAFNPLGQIPTLVLPDGQSLFDSLVICEYLDLLGHGPKMLPVLPRARIDTLQRHALGHATADLAMHILAARRLPLEQQLPGVLQRRTATLERVLSRLDELVPVLAVVPPDLGHVAIACALSYIDFRRVQPDWRSGRGALGAWFADFAARPSMVATDFVDDLAVKPDTADAEVEAR